LTSLSTSGAVKHYGFSFYHDTHERWVQLWFVECGGGKEDKRWQIYLEFPQGAPNLDLQLMKAFNHITWTTYTIALKPAAHGSADAMSDISPQTFEWLLSLTSPASTPVWYSANSK